MRKFKHKLKDITLVKCKNGNSYSSQNWEGYYIPSEFVENSSDWEEIVEKDYEILSFKNQVDEIFNLQSDGAYKQSIDDRDHHWRTLKFMLETATKCAIYSVKRLSDGEIFTVGDLINGHLLEEIFIAPSNKNDIVLSCQGLRRALYLIEDCHLKIDKQPLFKTIDGVDILENQPYWGVSTKNFTLEENLEGSVKASIPYYFEDKITDDFLTFSNRENAERYINLNSPKYSIKDILPIVNNWSMCRIDEDNILNFLAKKQ